MFADLITYNIDDDDTLTIPRTVADTKNNYEVLSTINASPEISTNNLWFVAENATLTANCNIHCCRSSNFYNKKAKTTGGCSYEIGRLGVSNCTLNYIKEKDSDRIKLIHKLFLRKPFNTKSFYVYDIYPRSESRITYQLNEKETITEIRETQYVIPLFPISKLQCDSSCETVMKIIEFILETFVTSILSLKICNVLMVPNVSDLVINSIFYVGILPANDDVNNPNYASLGTIGSANSLCISFMNLFVFDTVKLTNKNIINWYSKLVKQVRAVHSIVSDFLLIKTNHNKRNMVVTHECDDQSGIVTKPQNKKQKMSKNACQLKGKENRFMHIPQETIHKWFCTNDESDEPTISDYHNFLSSNTITINTYTAKMIGILNSQRDITDTQRLKVFVPDNENLKNKIDDICSIITQSKNLIKEQLLSQNNQL